MSARACIPEWQGLASGRCWGSHISPRSELRERSLALRGFSAYKIRLPVGHARTLQWFAGHTQSNDLFVGVGKEELNLDLDYGENGALSRVEASPGVCRGENVAVASLLNVEPIVNQSLDHEGRNVMASEPAGVVSSSGVSRLERLDNSTCLSSKEAGVASLDCLVSNELVSRNPLSENDDGIGVTATPPELGLDDLEYYVPKIGHRVLGVVVSGSRTKLDVDIGAAKLGELKVSQLFPLDRFHVKHNKWICPEEVDADGARVKFLRPPYGHPCMVYDKEVFAYEDPATFIVDIGTVIELMVIGISLSGNPVLSARKAAQRIAWDRVKQVNILDQLVVVICCKYPPC